MKFKPTLFLFLLFLLKFNAAIAQPCSAGIISASRDSVCALAKIGQSAIAQLTVNGDSGNLQWQRADSLPINFTNIPGATTEIYSSGYIFHDMYYRVISKTNSCSDTSLIKKIKVNQGPYVSFSYNTPHNAPFEFDFDFTVDSSLNAIDFFWDFGDSTTSNEQNPHHTYDSVGIYHVCLTVKNKTNCNFTQCRNVAIVDPPPPDAHCYADFTLAQDASNPHIWYMINESSTSSYDCYLNPHYCYTTRCEWGDGSSSGDFEHTYNAAGKYRICLTMHKYTYPPCWDTHCDSTSQLAAGDKIVLKNFPSSVNKVSPHQNKLNIYPNPCNTCWVEGVDDANDIAVIDMMGRKVKVVLSSTGNDISINLPNSPTGVYFIKQLVSGQVIKFVKE